MQYKKVNDENGNLVNILLTLDDGKTWNIPLNTDNTDYINYLAWVEAGNTAEDAD